MDAALSVCFLLGCCAGTCWVTSLVELTVGGDVVVESINQFLRLLVLIINKLLKYEK